MNQVHIPSITMKADADSEKRDFLQVTTPAAKDKGLPKIEERTKEVTEYGV